MLRDLRLSTKMLILFELIENPKTTLKPVAEKLEMTIQGVSEYLRRMRKEGEIQRIGKEYRITQKGVQFLQDSIQELREFVVSVLKRLDIIQVCSAIARTPIKKGKRVGLFMEDGRLMARASMRSSSTGIAIMDANPGDDVSVTALEGIVELPPGKLVILEIPFAEKRGIHTVLTGRMKKILSKIEFDRLGALDAAGLVLARKLKLKCDFEFAPALAGVEAAQKGLNVALIGRAEEARRVVSMLDEMNNRAINKIKFELVRLT